MARRPGLPDAPAPGLVLAQVAIGLNPTLAFSLVDEGCGGARLASQCASADLGSLGAVWFGQDHGQPPRRSRVCKSTHLRVDAFMPFIVKGWVEPGAYLGQSAAERSGEVCESRACPAGRSGSRQPCKQH